MSSRRLLAALIAACVLVPTLAAARPACCVKVQAPKRPACCASMAAAAPKSCCKAPAAPRPEPRSKDGLTAVVVAVTLALPHAREAGSSVPEVVAVRLARRGHRAASPDDSPPDLLSLHPALLI